MSLEVQINEMDHQLLMEAVGQYTLTNLRALIDRVREESQKRAKCNVILDVTEVAGIVPVVDLHLLGGYCARVWKQELRIAIISSEAGPSKFFEHVARKEGARIAVVANQDAAIEWLR